MLARRAGLSLEIPLTRWAEHFSDLLNHVNPSDPSIFVKLPTLPYIYELAATPSFDEISRAAKSIKNNKSAGPDGISGEVFKYGGHHVLHRLYKFICDTWLAEELPQKWKVATIVTIYKKKGDESLCTCACHVRTASRPCCRCSHTRIPVYGFRKNRSTVDMIFVARLLQEKCREQNQSLYLAWADLGILH